MKLPFNWSQPGFSKEEAGKGKLRLYILIGVLLTLILVAFGIRFFLQGSTQTPVIPGIPGLTEQQLQDELAQILPQLERQEGGQLTPSQDYLEAVVDPFSAPIELLGVIKGEQDLAIIKAQQVSYILAIGDKIADTWELTEINRDYIVLNNETREITIAFAPRK